MNQDCVFQPVSSSSSTAFVPVSAVPGGVPPGTQLFGAYGQPLAPNPMPSHAGYPPGGSPGYYQQPMHSPTTPYPPYGDNRDNASSTSGGSRRRPRTSDSTEDLGVPPRKTNRSSTDDPHQRSPATSSNTESPPLYYGAPSRDYDSRTTTAMHSPGGSSGTSTETAQPARSHPGSHHQGHYSDRTPPSARNHASGPPSSSNSVMNLSTIMDTTQDIDRNMLGKLDRRQRK
jgi:hypothetical protein